MRLPLQEQGIFLLVFRRKMPAMHAMLNSLHSMCLLQEQRIFLLVFAKQKSESSDEERIFLLNKNAQRWLFSSAPLYADNTLAHHITKCKYYVIHFVLSYYFSVNIIGE